MVPGIGNTKTVCMTSFFKIHSLILFCYTAFVQTTPFRSINRVQPNMVHIKQTKDFAITGDGTAAAWNTASWITIPFLDGDGKRNTTKAKLLYSTTGIYCLFSCQDDKLTATMQQDFLDLWNEDVIELFFQPDAGHPAYFEYELSPLNYELPLLILNDNGKLNSWIPFKYEGDRKTRHKVTVQGGEQKSNAIIKGWTAEFFIPYVLMKPVLSAPPVPGTTWKGNLYRIDYDHQNKETQWALYKNSGNFHEHDKFGDFYFE